MQLGDTVLILLTAADDQVVPPVAELVAPAVVTRVMDASIANLTVFPDCCPPFIRAGVSVYPTEADARAAGETYVAWPK